MVQEYGRHFIVIVPLFVHHAVYGFLVEVLGKGRVLQGSFFPLSHLYFHFFTSASFELLQRAKFQTNKDSTSVPSPATEKHGYRFMKVSVLLPTNKAKCSSRHFVVLLKTCEHTFKASLPQSQISISYAFVLVSYTLQYS